ncbi:MAG: UDP-2,4-diacetamido-2,4,6-trideoxy-beta-L-altropyranose hydrolase [Chloroflexi bacterium]|nr:UDP-2,4-diacetamido-2,4,6-trideoxy-beta-L-altropyranose hydrolase [Chloroflexota bacterium]
MTVQRLLIRADASAEIGTGHVMRCLALAQAWQDRGGAVTFCCASLPPALASRLASENIIVCMLDVAAASMADADAVIRLAGEIGASAVVVDGYVFGAAYQRRLKDAGLRLLFIDDNVHAEQYYADFVLNQNIHADAEMYMHCEPYTRLLLGTSYALLRREFRYWCGWRRPTINSVEKLLLTLGGSDPNNLTEQILTLLEDHYQTLSIRVITGSGNLHYGSLKQRAQQSSHRVTVHQNVSDMPEQMAWADIAISASGTTVWELIFMGLPTVLVIAADNQREIAERLSTMNVARLATLSDLVAVLGEFLESPPTIDRTLVDGYGVDRIVAHLRNDRIWLRRALYSDAQMLWNWVNDPHVRQMSFESNPISWETHLAWLNSSLEQSNRAVLIGYTMNNEPIGQIRLDKRDRLRRD